jgi:hypothetical protein
MLVASVVRSPSGRWRTPITTPAHEVELAAEYVRGEEANHAYRGPPFR